MSPAVRAVLFDLDGTLVDTWDLYIEAYVRALEPVYGRRIAFEELRGLHPTSELGLMKTVAGAGHAELHASFLRIYGELHGELFGGVYPGAREALGALRGAGFPVGIVTGKSRGAWEHTRTRADLGDFAVVVVDDDVTEPKPHPGGLLQAVAALGLEPGQVVYVGDSVGDARAAAAGGLPFAPALWAKSAGERDDFLERVREAGLWRAFDSPAELAEGLLGGAAGVAPGR